MFRHDTYSLLSRALLLALAVCVAPVAQASLMVPALPDFTEEHLAALQSDDLAPEAGSMSPEQDDAQAGRPDNSPLNPLHLTARKGLLPTGPSSSSSSSSAPSIGSGGVTLLAIVGDSAAAIEAEQSTWLSTASAVVVPSAVQSRLFRPPRRS